MPKPTPKPITAWFQPVSASVCLATEPTNTRPIHKRKSNSNGEDGATCSLDAVLSVAEVAPEQEEPPQKKRKLERTRSRSTQDKTQTRVKKKKTETTEKKKKKKKKKKDDKTKAKTSKKKQTKQSKKLKKTNKTKTKTKTKKAKTKAKAKVDFSGVVWAQIFQQLGRKVDPKDLHKVYIPPENIGVVQPWKPTAEHKRAMQMFPSAIRTRALSSKRRETAVHWAQAGRAYMQMRRQQKLIELPDEETYTKLWFKLDAAFFELLLTRLKRYSMDNTARTNLNRSEFSTHRDFQAHVRTHESYWSQVTPQVRARRSELGQAEDAAFANNAEQMFTALLDKLRATKVKADTRNQSAAVYFAAYVSTFSAARLRSFFVHLHKHKLAVAEKHKRLFSSRVWNTVVDAATDWVPLSQTRQRFVDVVSQFVTSTGRSATFLNIFIQWTHMF